MPLGMPATAQAQPPAREQQQRQVVVPNNPDEPIPEVRVAANTLTLFRFGSALDRASVEIEGRATRFRFVDVGERTIVLELAVEPDPEERLIVRVRYKDGASPAYATFALVSHPTLVDKEVEVMRRPRTLDALEAALAEKDAQLAALRAVSGPAGLVFSGRLNLDGVQARRLMVPASPRDGLKVTSGEGYRAGPWALAVFRVRNLPGQKPWEPGEARLTRADGLPVKVRSVDMNRAQLGPGEEGLVAVETETPFWKADETLRLELLDKSGSRHLPILEVKL
ncbi:DUF2381 family protein [Vitiosangium sp. GDMCC 1.1324]|uniref:DUF2381 family protein n=1 Tax=Vitiosangium sp. (strain GDMCC 1.1324) TaxID=2138576 RepID=UPI002101CF38|nr:DUF2381 family protein [Vitiosangium sp. GDMCC 1.1324]